MASALHGLLAGLTLIIAIGSQNVFVLRQGIRREHVLPVVAGCIALGGVRITAGASGLGVLVRAVPELVAAARWTGIAFLLGYAMLAACRALRGRESLQADGVRRGSGLGAVVATALAFTWLNPHMYLDTVLLLGSIAATHGAQAWKFAAGQWWAARSSSRRWGPEQGLGQVLSSARAWRVLDVLVAVTMVMIAGMLTLG